MQARRTWAAEPIDRYRRVAGGVFTLLLLGLLAACRSAGPAAGPERLVDRPMYTFSEAELGEYVRYARTLEPELTERIVHLGRKNLGQPYDIYLLGEFPYELIDPDPIYCLSKSDCLTFSEHTYAAALGDDWWSYLRFLQRLRYRDGVISMLTRNHYTIADWDRNNAFLFEDLTTRLGGGEACVPLQQVCRRARFFAKFGLGQDIPDEPIHDHYIPKENVPAVLAELHNGDFVNIIRGNAEAQYCGHTGLIAIAADGTVDFLHSAQPAVREQPLTEFLASDKRCLGIKILRLRPDAERIMRDELAGSTTATPVNEAAFAAALAANPVMSTGAPAGYAENWTNAMRLQAYRLENDTPPDAALQAELAALDERIGTALGIPAAERAFGVLDLTDLRPAMVRPDAMFYGASVPKICIVLAYFATHPEAAEHLDPQVEDELGRVIKISSNELAAKYSQIVGLDQIQELLQSKRYRFYDREHGGFWCGKHYGVEEPRMGDPVHDHSHAATVRQCLRYYLMLEQGNLESAAVCAKLKQVFAAPVLDFNNSSFVRGLNGRDVTVLRKGGLWEDWHLDTARVQHGERLYLLAGMVHHPKGEEYLTQMAAAVDDLLCGQRPPKPYLHQSLHHAPPPGATAEGGGLVLTPDAPVYESPVITPAEKFNEALVSWNIAAPEGTGYSVEVRAARYDETWTPWLRIDAWGLGADEPGVTTCENARIDVDYFRSDLRFNSLQYRITARGTAPVTVARVDLCLSDTTGIPTALPWPTDDAPAPPPAAWQRTLPVPHRSQHTDNPELTGICSPTSVTMTLAYRGVDLPVAEVAAASYDPAHDIYGNWPRAVQAAYTLGVPGYLTRFSDWAAVERMIAAGQPVIASIKVFEENVLRGAPYGAIGGHLIVLTGFDADGNVKVNDPALRTPERGCLTLYREDLEKVWMRSLSAGTAYILLPVE